MEKKRSNDRQTDRQISKYHRQRGFLFAMDRFLRMGEEGIITVLGLIRNPSVLIPGGGGGVYKKLYICTEQNQENKKTFQHMRIFFNVP
jgi:hypothetical protein